MLRIFNTLTRKIEEFTPLDPTQVGIYTCGPTVYDYMHIGNLRTFLLSDFLRRTLEMNGYQVKLVQNITDIEDKIIKRAKEKNISPSELTVEYTNYFNQDVAKLNILSPSVQPKATEHIKAMIKFIEDLIKKGLAYMEKDGSVYFDISEFADYGKLSLLDKRQLKTGTRSLSDEYTKDDVQDFALWKSAGPGEVGWSSLWGKGRPGWHIECSVMSQEYLGETFDIHVGGIDLLFPHHENEIAQSEGKTGKKFVNYFVHGEHLLVDGARMGKSLKNFYTLKDLEGRGFEPLAYRYLVLTAHYRDKLNFTWESLEAAQNALNNLREIIREWPSVILGRSETTTPESKKDSGRAPLARMTEKKFTDAINNDLNMPQALAVLWEMVKSDLPGAEKSAVILEMDKILGLKLDDYLGKPLGIPTEVMELVEKREAARKSGDFEKADELRKEINKKGFSVEDTQDGPKLRLDN